MGIAKNEAGAEKITGIASSLIILIVSGILWLE
jgi:hypothetical protein